MITRTEKEEYAHLLRYLEYTLHELPAGVLYDANGANDRKCAELMKDSYRLEELAVAMEVDLSEFLATCRWHYERYPHYRWTLRDKAAQRRLALRWATE